MNPTLGLQTLWKIFLPFKHSPTSFLKFHEGCSLRNLHAKYTSEVGVGRGSQPKKKKLPQDAIGKTAAPPPHTWFSFSRQEAWPKALIQIKNQEICMANRHRVRSLAGGRVGGVHGAHAELRPQLFA